MKFAIVTLMILAQASLAYSSCYPVDGYLTKWSKWTACSKPCGGGTKGRDRECVGPQCYGKPCPYGLLWEKRDCNKGCCPVDGYFTQWTAWSSCTKTCGGGKQRRSRRCEGRKCRGKRCYGDVGETRDCNKDCCPVDGQWSSWKSTPGQCTKSCGGGQRLRWRKCEGQECGGKYCYGPSESSVICNNRCCPVDGKFTAWGDWYKCSKSCGGGTQLRARRCEGKKCGGKGCYGSVADRRACGEGCCPVDGYLTQWTKWTACSKSCEGGTQGRDRRCVGPECYGKPCPYGKLWEGRDCNKNVCCPVNGYFTQWSEWYKCSKTCGGGIQRRSRRCEGKACGGKGCFGNVGENRPCNKDCCPVDGQWSSWKSTPGQCTKPCGGGLRYRWRKCEGQQCGGKYCYGPSESSVICNNRCCPVDGKFTAWGEWYKCSKSCGGGSQLRARRCEGKKCGGKGCYGSVADRRACNEDCCPVDGKWSSWKSTPGQCTKSCGGGLRNRWRKCEGRECGGKYCYGPSESSVICNNFRCPYSHYY